MKFGEYLSSRSIFLSFYAIAVIFITGILHVMEIDLGLILMVDGFFILISISYCFLSFFSLKRRIQKLQAIVNNTPEKYLVGEMLPPPSNPAEQEYFNIIQTISRSAIGKAKQATDQMDDYCDYVESWIHEIKTPLASANLMVNNNSDKQRLKAELRRADNLTDSILHYARLKNPSAILKFAEVSVHAVLDETIRSQMELLMACGISIDISGDFRVNTDSVLLGFICRQFLSNSSKYAPGCHIDIKITEPSIVIEDNGPGIQSYDLPRIMNKGFIGDNGRNKGGSSGMGLFIASCLCEKLGISLTAESTPGEFARFTLTFLSLTQM